VDAGLEIAVVGWLPDSQTVIYAVRGENGFGLKSHRLQTGVSRDYFTFDNKGGFATISPDGQWISFADRVFGSFPYGIFISRLDGSERRLIADPELISMYKTVWSPNGQWLALRLRNSQGAFMEGTSMTILVNPFSCQALRLDMINGFIEDWSP
jgi:Tol biopolymer transport system component